MTLATPEDARIIDGMTTSTLHRAAGAALALVFVAADAGASRFIIADRDIDGLWSISDADKNGAIDDPSGIVLFFDSSNAAGTPATENPTCLAVRRDGLVLVGDQLGRTVYLFQDLNNDDDALDPGESRIVVSSPNGSGITIAFPTGAAFDSLGRAFIANAGNSFGNDAIYLLLDLNNDGDSLDAGEIVEFVGVGAFGPGNGPWGPQEILFVASPGPGQGGDIGFMRNSTANLHGVYRFRDIDNNGRADDPGEFAAFWDATGSSGVTPLPGFALELDNASRSPACGVRLYTLQTAAGGVDQLVRLSDNNNDGDAQDPGEAVIAWSTAEAGFTGIDVQSRVDGTVLVTDGSGGRIIALRDLDNDGLFMSAGERTDYFANPAGPVSTVRQIALIEPQPCPADANGDGVVNGADLSVLLSSFGQAGAGPGFGDFNGDCAVNGADLSVLLGSFGISCQ